MTIRSRIADTLLGPEKRKLSEAAAILADAYQRGPLLVSPEQLIERLAELDSRYLDLLARQIRNNTSTVAYEATEADRRSMVDYSRRMYDNDVVTEALVNMWTSFGFGANVDVLPRDADAKAVWAEFFTAPRNSYVLGQRSVQDLSRRVLCDGDFLFLFYTSTIDGTTTVRVVPTQEIKGGGVNDCGVITLPADACVPVLYRHETRVAIGTPAQAEHTALYYRDWRATDAMVEQVLPEKADGTRGFDDGALADEVNENTEVTALLVPHRPRLLRGWPLMTTGLAWASAYKDFLQDRAAIGKAAAMYFDKLKVKGGQRAVDALVASLQSSMATSGSGYERNPVPVAGSSWVENEQVDRSRMSMATGAGDAAQDSAAILGQAGLAAGVYPHYLGRGEAFRLATSTSMERPTFLAFNNYQLFWASVWRDAAYIVLSAAERHGNKSFTSKAVDVNTDAILAGDINLIGTFLEYIASAVEKLGMPREQAAVLLPHLVRIGLQSLGVRGVDDIMRAMQSAGASPAATVPAPKVPGAPSADVTAQEATLAEARPFGPDAYRTQLRSAVRGLWTGGLTPGDFRDAMTSAIRRGLTDAWYAGAEAAGITAEELSPEELAALQETIVAEHAYIAGLAEAVTAASKAAGGKLTAFDGRLDEWARRWDEVKTRAQMMAGADKKFKWSYSPEAEHCPDCPKLHGKVKRGSTWTAAGLAPRANVLKCSIGCKCSLDPTDDPVTRGPLPRLG